MATETFFRLDHETFAEYVTSLRIGDLNRGESQNTRGGRRPGGCLVAIVTVDGDGEWSALVCESPKGVTYGRIAVLLDGDTEAKPPVPPLDARRPIGRPQGSGMSEADKAEKAAKAAKAAAEREAELVKLRAEHAALLEEVARLTGRNK